MIPETIGRYAIERELGRGGMAIVYLARDPNMDRQVAVKVLPRQFTFDPQFQARFQREAKVIAKLEHPAIVPVYDAGEHDGQPYIVMRYMRGVSLTDRLKGDPLPVQEASRILSRLAPALDKAHSTGIIHRDLKPANILFDDDSESYLSDFGIAKISESTAAFTGSAIIGTPAYMSPEQARGAGIDGRSDVYSLGVILFEMLSGSQPYEADTPMGVAMRHITDPVPRILEVNPDLPEGVDEVLQRALAKKPDERFQTAAELAESLGELVSVPSAGAVPAVEIMTPQADREKTIAGAVAEPEEDVTSITGLEPGKRAGPAAAQPVKRGKRRLKVPMWGWAIGALVVSLAVVGSVFAAAGGSLFSRKTPTATAAVLSDELLVPQDKPAATLTGTAMRLAATASETVAPTSTMTSSPTETATPTDAPQLLPTSTRKRVNPTAKPPTVAPPTLIPISPTPRPFITIIVPLPTFAIPIPPSPTPTPIIWVPGPTIIFPWP
jgi:serine/threonine-protein kinase